jgi:alanine racemase
MVSKMCRSDPEDEAIEVKEEGNTVETAVVASTVVEAVEKDEDEVAVEVLEVVVPHVVEVKNHNSSDHTLLHRVWYNPILKHHTCNISLLGLQHHTAGERVSYGIAFCVL